MALRRFTKYNRNGIPKVNQEQPVPVGTIIGFAGTTAPGGWLLCQGGEALKTNYPTLNTICGTTYGANTNGSGAAGTTHFRLPDLRGAIPIGAGTGAGDAASGTGATSGTALTARTLGATAGAATVTLTSAQSGSPAHNHGVNQNTHSHTVNESGHTHSLGLGGVNVINATPAPYLPDGGGVTYQTWSTSDGFSINSSTSGITVQDNAGESATSAHSNTQPVLVVTYIIRAL